MGSYFKAFSSLQWLDLKVAQAKQKNREQQQQIIHIWKQQRVSETAKNKASPTRRQAEAVNLGQRWGVSHLDFLFLSKIYFPWALTSSVPASICGQVLPPQCFHCVNVHLGSVSRVESLCACRWKATQTGGGGVTLISLSMNYLQLKLSSQDWQHSCVELWLSAI